VAHNGERIVDRRTLITGIEVVATGDIGSKAFWELLTSGRTATRRISFFDPEPLRSPVATECAFGPVGWAEPREIRWMDRATQLAPIVSTRSKQSPAQPRS
jgi:act minimal PKS ketosynthase (KS/KS alpha)